MKIFIKLVFIAVIMVWIGSYFIIGTNVMPLLTRNAFQHSKFPSINELRNKARQIFSTDTKSQITNSVQVYKWQDQKGVIHYSDQNDPRYKSKLTDLKKITILPVHTKKASDKFADPNTKHSSTIPGFTTIPLQQIPTLIKNAKQAKILVEERKNKLDKVLESH